MLSQIDKRYDPDNDTTQGGPPVTWAEYELYWAIADLTRRIEWLENENRRLSAALRDATTLASGESLE